ncbi:PsbP-related protein [Puia dinghuensis]|uniref:PsbP C-terminal domain-containing protein n=1 Tax=Puia dinghuensis TaxID=1792502 RepID=A0A8J2UEL6_9BACT|nr:PsbP-related protein [Puia dinghuensis]GGB07040.1 hypothetical protein GCM10011511_33140 [Puia dinghuensis]
MNHTTTLTPVAKLCFCLAIMLVPGWLTYTNSANKFTVNYPKEWTHRETGNSVLFLSPKENENDDFQENVNIMLQDLSANPLNLEQYTALSKKMITENAAASTILSSTPTTFAGQKAMETIYTMTFEGRAMKLQQIWFIKNKTAYVFTYTAEQSQYARYEPTATAIINSFKFLR